jgi:D-3-phosphoglycerate dehydrogenase
MIEIAVAAGLMNQIEAVRGHLDGVARFREIDIGTPEEIAAGTADADALVVTLQPLRFDHLTALGARVRVVGRAGVGLDTIDLAAAATLGVGVVNQPDYATAEVATHTVAMLLAVHRRLLAANEVARGDWGSWISIGSVTAIEEQTVGIVGCGRIGRAVIERLRPFAGRIVVQDPALSAAPEGAELVAELADLLPQSDILSLHLPLSDETRGIMSADKLKVLPEGAILVNVSRGGLVDEQALVDAVREGRLAGAALDVMADEPPPADSPILSEPRILLSPHIGWYSESASTRLWRLTVDSVVQYLSGRPVTAGNIAVQGHR